MDKWNGLVWLAGEVLTGEGFLVRLTPRQREVLLLLCEGLPNKLVGRRLGLSGATVKSHVASVLRSLNVATRLEAVAAAYRLGLVARRETERAAPCRPERMAGGVPERTGQRVGRWVAGALQPELRAERRVS